MYYITIWQNSMILNICIYLPIIKSSSIYHTIIRSKSVLTSLALPRISDVFFSFIYFCPSRFLNIFSCIPLFENQGVENVSVRSCLDLKILWVWVKFRAEFHNFCVCRVRHRCCHFAETERPTCRFIFHKSLKYYVIMLKILKT